MRKGIIYLRLFILAAVLSGTVSCRKPFEATTFHPKLEILTQTISGRKDFSFRIYSNTGSFVLESFECSDYDGLSHRDFPFDGLTVGTKYTCDGDGWKVFSARSVTVRERSIGLIKVVIKDDVTGVRETLSASYRKYRGIYCSKVSVKCSRDGRSYENGYVVDGETLDIILSTNLNTSGSESREFVVQDFRSPFGSDMNNSQKGRSYVCDDNGNAVLTLRDVKVPEERPDSVVVVIEDPATRDTVHAKVSFAMRHGLDSRFRVEGFDAATGRLRAIMEARRRKVAVTEFRIDPVFRKDGETVKTLGDMRFSPSVNPDAILMEDMAVEFPEQSYFGGKYSLTYTSDRISCVETRKDVHMVTTIMDMETGRFSIDDSVFETRMTEKPSYVAFQSPSGGPEIVCEASKDGVFDSSALKNIYRVSYADGSSIGDERGYRQIIFRLLDSDGKPFAGDFTWSVSLPASASGSVAMSTARGGSWSAGTLEGSGPDGSVWVKGGSSGGRVVNLHVVFKFDSSEMSMDVPVTVQARAALVLKGTFTDLRGDTCSCCDVNNVGWNGVPTKIWMELCTYSAAVSGNGDPLLTIPMAEKTADLEQFFFSPIAADASMSALLDVRISCDYSEDYSFARVHRAMRLGGEADYYRLLYWNDDTQYIGCRDHGHRGSSMNDITPLDDENRGGFTLSLTETDQNLVSALAAYCDCFNYVRRTPTSPQKRNYNNFYVKAYSGTTIWFSVSSLDNVPAEVDLRHLVLEISNGNHYWINGSPIRQTF